MKIFLKIIFAAALLFIVGLLYNSPEKSESTICEDIEKSNNAAKSWLWNNFREKGLFIYRYNPETDSAPNSNNSLRQLMASIILAKEAQKDSEILEMHSKNLEFVFKYWFMEHEDMGYVFYNDKSKLGSNAMLLRTLVYSPLFNQYEKEAKKIAEGILVLQEPGGKLYPWIILPDYDFDEDYLMYFYSGEAILALIEYYEKTGDEKYLEAAKLSQDFYIEEYVTNMSENYYPAYVPWHTISLNKLYKISPDPKYLNAIIVMNNELLKIQDTKNEIGRFYNPAYPKYGTPHVSSDAIYTEGLLYAYEAIKDFDPSVAQKYKKAINLGMKNLQKLQYIDDGLREKTYGGLRINIENPEIRVDNVQHYIDASQKYVENFCLRG